MRLARVYIGMIGALLALASPLRAAGEIETSQGRIIRGLSRAEAIQKYGYPQAVGDETWMYRTPGGTVYVYLPPEPSLTLYPRQIEAEVGDPLEFKAYHTDTTGACSEVTAAGSLIVSDPAAFEKKQANVLVPRRQGVFTAAASHNGLLSSPCRIVVRESAGGSGGASQERLLKIEALPFNPVVHEGEGVMFSALGVFLDAKGAYSVRDIGSQAQWSYAGARADNPDAQSPWTIFPEQGEATVSCRYGGLSSLPLTARVGPPGPRLTDARIRHISLLPDLITVEPDKQFSLLVLATCEDNNVKNITSGCQFTVKGACVRPEGGGRFTGTDEGVAEITAMSAGRRATAKVCVVKGADETLRERRRELRPKKEERRLPPARQIKHDIAQGVRKLGQELAVIGRLSGRLTLEPQAITLDPGGSAAVAATAAYSNGRSFDVSAIADWSSSAPEIARVDKGTVIAVSPGSAFITADYRGSRSQPANVTVSQRKVVSIVLTAETPRLGLGERARLKAEGVFSDGSREDITGSVSWRVAGGRGWVDKGMLKAVWPGDCVIIAEKDGVSSLPVTVRVVYTLRWFLGVLLDILLVTAFLLGACGALLAYRLRVKLNLINSQRDDPAARIISLYANLIEVFTLFGLETGRADCPRAIAAKAEKRFGFAEGGCLRFVALFEEAKYSGHAISPAMAREAEEACVSLQRSLYNGQQGAGKARIRLLSLLRHIPLLHKG